MQPSTRKDVEENGMEGENLLKTLSELLDGFMEDSRGSSGDSKTRKKAMGFGYHVGKAEAYLECANMLAAAMAEAEGND